MMQFTEDHYAQLLGLEAPWSVESVDLSVEELRVLITLEYSASTGACPKCSKECRVYDLAPKRRWRHLETMQFETLIEGAVPRVDCSEHGVLTTAVPWAGKHSRFTLMYEAFALEVLKNTPSISKACGLLKLDWHAVNEIRKRAVERGLSRRRAKDVPFLGMDEKCIGKGYKFTSLAVDIDRK